MASGGHILSGDGDCWPVFDSVQVDVLFVEPVEAGELVIGPEVVPPIVLDALEFVCNCAVDVPQEAFQDAVFGDIVFSVRGVANEAAAVCVAGFGAGTECGAPVD